MKRSAILLFSLVAVLRLHAQPAEGPEKSEQTERPAGPQKKEEKPFPVLSSVGLRNQSGEQLFQAQARADFALALELKDRRNYSSALRRFQDFRLLYPAHPQTAIVVGHIADIYERLSQPDRALAELRKYLKTFNGAPQASAQPLLARLADLEYRLGQWPQSIATYELLLAAFPASAEAELAGRRLAEMQAEPEPSDAEGDKQPVPRTDSDTSPGKAPKNDESSLDRLGEGLDIEN